MTSWIDDLMHSIVAARADGRGLDDVLGGVLRGLNEIGGLQRPTLALLDRMEGVIRVEAAHGLTPSETRRIRWRLGEGVVGRVVQSGRAQVISEVSRSEVFADKFGWRETGRDGGFVAVPVGAEGMILGAVSAWLLGGVSTEELQSARRRLEILAALLEPLVEQKVGGRRGAALSLADEQPGALVGRSKRMREVYDLIGQVAPSAATVLLLGESGTGKELVARAVHEGSPRAAGPFVRVNCAALPASMIESELFGHERGSFTGAMEQRKGRFELADGGTIFLDEIGDLALETQIKLLRVLQEREFERVGSATPIRADVRVVAATSRDLEAMMEEGTFRPDLFYRLHVFPIRLPALRERRDDVLLLAEHFLARFAREQGREIRRIATPAIDLLMTYHWPGNVRELENCIERAVLLARGDVLMAHHLPPSLQGPEPREDGGGHGLQATLDALERDLIVDALKAHHGNRAAAARGLGLTERQMGLRVHKYGIDARRFRPRGTET